MKKREMIWMNTSKVHFELTSFTSPPEYTICARPGEEGDMRQKTILPTLAFILLTFITCQAYGDEDWPQHVRDSIWLPRQAFDVQRSSVNGSFQIVYAVKACFPARNLIDAMAESMASAHWKRLLFDPLNPGTMLSFGLEKSSNSRRGWWSTYPWKDFWKDKQGNVVYYQFWYDVDGPVPGAFLEAAGKSCSLKGYAVFYPKEVWRQALEAEKGKH
jgi:hypothetical protein